MRRNWVWLFATILVVPSIVVAGTKEDTPENYWKETNLKYDELIADSVKDRTCYMDAEHFYGCLHALTTLMTFKKDERLIGFFTEDYIQAHLTDRNPTILRRGHPLSVVAYDGVKLDSFVDLMASVKAERAATYESWTRVYQNPDQGRVDFEDYVAWVKNQIDLNADREALITAAGFNAYLAEVFDPHTRIAPYRQLADSMQDDNTSFIGVGIALRQVNGQTLVIQPLEGGVAHKAGVHAGDIITHVDGVSIEDKNLDDIIKMIRGPKGESVELTVKRNESSLHIRIVRDEVRVENVEHKLIAGPKQKLGFIKVRRFMDEKTCEDTKAAISTLERDGAQTLVLDLRGNPGGLIDQAACMVDLFIDKDLTITTQKPLQGGEEDVLKSTTAPFTNLPLIVLINAGSASASEIVSGALQDYDRAVILGERSTGKGSFQGIEQLTFSVVFVRTGGYFYLPAGRTNQIHGIVPDLESYGKPNPTEEDKLAFREEDAYFNPLPPESAPYAQTRPEYIKLLSACLDADETAESTFSAESSAAIPPDFDLLMAHDLAACMSEIVEISLLQP